MLRKRPTPPLFLSVTLLFFFLPSSSSSWQTGISNPRLFKPDEDYENYSDDPLTTAKPRKTPAPLCEYDLCKDQLEPCQDLNVTRSCSCPGISGPFQPPDPPSIQSLSIESNGVVVVRWCAPSSTVLHYQVYVEGENKVHEVAENRRMMELGDLAPDTEVCVKAVNKAGSNDRGENSCTRFEPNNSETRLIKKLALIGAAVVLVLVIALALLLWWCKRHRNAPARRANRGTGMVL